MENFKCKTCNIDHYNDDDFKLLEYDMEVAVIICNCGAYNEIPKELYDHLSEGRSERLAIEHSEYELFYQNHTNHDRI